MLEIVFVHLLALSKYKEKLSLRRIECSLWETNHQTDMAKEILGNIPSIAIEL